MMQFPDRTAQRVQGALATLGMVAGLVVLLAVGANFTANKLGLMVRASASPGVLAGAAAVDLRPCGSAAAAFSDRWPH